MPFFKKNYTFATVLAKSVFCLQLSELKIVMRIINTVEELVNKTSDEMMKVRNLGRKSLDEILQKLNDMGLQLRKADER